MGISISTGVVDQGYFVEHAGGVSVGAYCGAQFEIDSKFNACYGVCPTGAISGGGTVLAIVVATFCNLTIQWIKPQTANFCATGQAFMGNMYLVSVAFRMWIGLGGGIQKFQAMWSFLMVGSCVCVMASALIVEDHYLHGFKTQFDYEKFLHILRTVKHNPTTTDHHGHSHFAHPNDGLLRKLYKAQMRNEAIITVSFFTFCLFFWAGLYWWIMWKDPKTFWQGTCEDLVNEHMFPVLNAVIPALGFMLLISCVVMFFSVFLKCWRREAQVALPAAPPKKDLKIVAPHRPKRAGGPAGAIGRAFHLPKRLLKWTQIVVPLLVYVVYIIALLVLWRIALDNFLLVGNAWTFAVLQNMIMASRAMMAFVMAWRGFGLDFTQTRRDRKTLNSMGMTDLLDVFLLRVPEHLRPPGKHWTRLYVVEAILKASAEARAKAKKDGAAATAGVTVVSSHDGSGGGAVGTVNLTTGGHGGVGGGAGLTTHPITHHTGQSSHSSGGFPAGTPPTGLLPRDGSTFFDVPTSQRDSGSPESFRMSGGVGGFGAPQGLDNSGASSSDDSLVTSARGNRKKKKTTKVKLSSSESSEGLTSEEGYEADSGQDDGTSTKGSQGKRSSSGQRKQQRAGSSTARHYRKVSTTANATRHKGKSTGVSLLSSDEGEPRLVRQSEQVVVPGGTPVVPRLPPYLTTTKDGSVRPRLQRKKSRDVLRSRPSATVGSGDERAVTSIFGGSRRTSQVNATEIPDHILHNSGRSGHPRIRSTFLVNDPQHSDTSVADSGDPDYESARRRFPSVTQLHGGSTNYPPGTVDYDSDESRRQAEEEAAERLRRQHSRERIDGREGRTAEDPGDPWNLSGGILARGHSPNGGTWTEV